MTTAPTPLEVLAALLAGLAAAALAIVIGGLL